MSRLVSLLVVFLIPFVGSSQAQKYLGPAMSSIHYTSYKVGNWSPGLQIDFSRERLLFRMTANVGIPSTREREYSLYFQDEFAYTETPNFAQTIGGKEAYNGMSLWFDVSYFLRGDGEIGGFYVLGGLGFSLLQINYTPDDFDNMQYYSDYDDLKRSSYFFPVMRFGTGYEFNLSFANLYAQGYINIPTSTEQSDVSGSPFSLGTTLGLRLPFRRNE